MAPSTDDPSPVNPAWRERRSGVAEVLRVAAPLVVSSLSWTVMTFVDRILLKWESGEAMSAAFSASIAWFAVMCLPLGVCAYANTFVSQYFGDGQYRRIGPAVWQGVWVAAMFTPLVAVAALFAPQLFEIAQHGDTIVRHEIVYFRILTIGGPGLLIAQSLSAFYSGRGRTSVVMLVDAACAVVNLLLDYLWIFGKAGFPAMGIAGAGWATVVALWLKSAIYVALLMRRANRGAFRSLAARWNRELLGRLLYFGGPSGVQMLLEVLGFTVFILLIGRIGPNEAEATAMAFSVSTLAFMPIWGFSQAVGILVGQRLGENRDDLAARATWTTLWISLAYMATISLLYVFVPELFLTAFFAQSQDALSNRHVIYPMAVKLLLFVAAYNLFDATLMVFVGALKGAGDTQFILRVSLVMAALLAGASWLGVEHYGVDVYGCWAIVTVWVWLMALIYFARFRQGRWRTMRVIEQRRRPSTKTAEREDDTILIDR